jgi:hypothetical protein
VSFAEPIEPRGDHEQALSIPDHLVSLSEEEIAERMMFIEGRLDAERRHARRWNRGWLGVFGTGAVLQSVRAGLADDHGARADYIVAAVKALGGSAQAVLRPLRAAHGADALREMPDQTRAQRLRAVARAEQLLRADAKRARERRSWKRHLISVAVNVTGGLIIWQGAKEPKRGAISAGLGIAVGGMHAWSQPESAIDDLREYEQRIASGGHSFRRLSAQRQVQVQFEIQPGGAGIRVTF